MESGGYIKSGCLAQIMAGNTEGQPPKLLDQMRRNGRGIEQEGTDETERVRPSRSAGILAAGLGSILLPDPGFCNHCLGRDAQGTRTLGRVRYTA